MIIPEYNPAIVKSLRGLIEDGIRNGLKFDLVAMSKICGHKVDNDDMEGVDEDTIDDSMVELICYGRPPKFQTISKNEFSEILNDMIDNKYSDGQQSWIIEMLEIMFSVPSGFIAEKIRYENMPVDALWNSINSYKPIIL